MIPLRRGTVWRAAVRLLSRHPLHFEEERRRLLYGSLAFIGISMLLIFGLSHLVAGPVVEGVIDLGAAAIMVISVWRLRLRRSGAAFYLSGLLLFVVLFLVLGILGDPQGSRALWSFTFPAFALFVGGTVYGLVFTLLLFGGWLVVLFAPPTWTGAPAYDRGFAIRFVAVYLTILFLSIFMEQVRSKYSLAMRRHQVRLERDKADLREARERMRDMAMRDQLRQEALPV